MKKKIIYECSQCGAKTPRWAGRCSNCGSWNTLIETIEESQSTSKKERVSNSSAPQRLSEIETKSDHRIKTDIGEFDRVLGGGIMPGSLILVGGDPGIGKSTLLLQTCGKLSSNTALYISGEESLKQIKHRAMRMKDINEDLLLIAENNLENIVPYIKSCECDIIVIDSIQSIFTDKIDASPGSISQVRECTAELMNIAKQSGKSIFIVGHVTKDGFIAGPKILEHSVDTVLQFEGEKNYSFRILRALKNRFGSTNEIGIFEMRDDGLHEVLNPSEVFLSSSHVNEPGVAVVTTLEGSRPLLIEVQALVTSTSYGVPQRSSNGFDLRRLQMILAVLEKRLGMQFRQYDVFVNVAGGIYLNDPSVDLGIAAAIVSSFKDEPLDRSRVLIGEIGLTGEVRPVARIEQRLKESEKLGFSSAVIPKQNFDKLISKYDFQIEWVDRISLALSKILLNS